MTVCWTTMRKVWSTVRSKQIDVLCLVAWIIIRLHQVNHLLTSYYTYAHKLSIKHTASTMFYFGIISWSIHIHVHVVFSRISTHLFQLQSGEQLRVRWLWYSDNGSARIIQLSLTDLKYDIILKLASFFST